MVGMLGPSIKPDGGFGCRTANLATTSTTPSSVATRRSLSAARLLPQERDVVFAPLVRGLADHRRIRGFDHSDQQFGIDLPGAEVSVPVAARTCRILGVVAVHQVDATGDALDPVDGVDQRLPRRPGVAGIEAEADSLVADDIPEPGDGVEMAGHRVISAGGVIEVHRDLRLQLVECLTPTLETLVEVGVFGDVTAVHDDCGGTDL